MDEWSFLFEGSAPAEEGLREALCTLGNGYIATRGAAPEYDADGVHYPGTYAAGCYNRLRDLIAGESVENESLVNLPNWLPLTFRVADGPWLGSPGVEVLAQRHVLDLRRGLLVRWLRVRDGAGRTTAVTQRRFVHLRQEHVCGLQTTITAVDWSGPVTIRSEVDAGVQNTGVARYRDLASRHLIPVRSGAVGDDCVVCVVMTNQSHVRIATAARTRAVCDEGSPASVTRKLIRSPGRVGHALELDLGPGQSVTVEKLVTIYTSRDAAISDPAVDAVSRLGWLPGFDELVEEHALAWGHVWGRFHLKMSGELDRALRVARLHLFHILQTVSPRSIGADVGVPARGLHGEAYRGHILWDELFILPILNLRLPVLSRAVLSYRHRRLGAARHAAAQAGRAGAMFPWQSGSDGREENQRLHRNPLSGRWVQDRTHRQRHVGLAIAYNVWQYCQASGDIQFFEHEGSEILLEVARFFADLAEYDHSRDRYVIRHVMGPDEFHTGYPDAPDAGIDNNAYTNLMVVWLLVRALETLDTLSAERRREVTETLGVSGLEIQRWEDISRRMFVPIHTDGVISQFEGYEELREFDWDGYRSRYGDIRRLDRILESEGEDPNTYRVSKQADVLMLFYLLSADELGELFSRLGYRLDPDMIPATIDFYLARTSHGSTLSAVVHAWVLARSRRAQAMEYLVRALESDLVEVQSGTTAEGIHLAAMAGSVDLLLRCFAGVETRGDTLFLNPYWPPQLGILEFDLRYRQHLLRLRITGSTIRVSAAPGEQSPIRLSCRGEIALLGPGEMVELSRLEPLDPGASPDEVPLDAGPLALPGRAGLGDAEGDDGGGLR